jgi:hypothetical protein
VNRAAKVVRASAAGFEDKEIVLASPVATSVSGDRSPGNGFLNGIDLSREL